MCRSNEQWTTSKGETWSRGRNSRLQFDVNVMLNLSTNPFSQTTVSDLKNWNYDNDDIKVFLEAKVTVSDCQNFLAV